MPTVASPFPNNALNTLTVTQLNSAFANWITAINSGNGDPNDTTNGYGGAYSQFGPGLTDAGGYYNLHGPGGASTDWYSGGWNIAAAIPADPALKALDPSTTTVTKSKGIAVELMMQRGALNILAGRAATTDWGATPFPGTLSLAQINPGSAQAGSINLDSSHSVTAGQLISTAASGIAPLVVNSPSVVANLNASYVSDITGTGHPATQLYGAGNAGSLLNLNGNGFYDALAIGYDSAEAATLDALSSTSTIVNSLNRIRYPLSVLSTAAGKSGSPFDQATSLLTSMTTGGSTLKGDVTLVPGSGLGVAVAGQTVTLSNLGLTSLLANGSTLTGGITMVAGTGATLGVVGGVVTIGSNATAAAAGDSLTVSDVYSSFVLSGMAVTGVGNTLAVGVSIANGTAYVTNSGGNSRRPMVAGPYTITNVTTPALAASTTQYVDWNGTDALTGFQVSTAANPATGYVRLAQVITGTTTVTSITDMRPFYQAPQKTLGHDLRAYGATPGSDVTSLITTIKGIVGTTTRASIIISGGSYTISSNLTIPSNITLHFHNGGVLSVSAGATLTINGSVLAAPTAQIFQANGSAGSQGTVAIGATAQMEWHAAWWGCVGDGSNLQAAGVGTDNGLALAAFLAAWAANNSHPTTGIFSGSYYRTTQTFLAAPSTSLAAFGKKLRGRSSFHDVAGAPSLGQTIIQLDKPSATARPLWPVWPLSTAAGTGINGTYVWIQTYQTASGESVCSMPGIVYNTGGAKASVTLAVTPSMDPNVTAINVYRAPSGTMWPFYKSGSVAQSVATGTLPQTFTDSMTDASLTSQTQYTGITLLTLLGRACELTNVSLAVCTGTDADCLLSLDETAAQAAAGNVSSQNVVTDCGFYGNTVSHVRIGQSNTNDCEMMQFRGDYFSQNDIAIWGASNNANCMWHLLRDCSFSFNRFALYSYMSYWDFQRATFEKLRWCALHTITHNGPLTVSNTDSENIQQLWYGQPQGAVSGASPATFEKGRFQGQLMGQVQAPEAPRAVATGAAGNVPVGTWFYKLGWRVWQVSLGSPTAGTFTLTVGGQTTTGIVFGGTGANVQNALAALSTVGTGNVTVTGLASGPYTVVFSGSAAGATLTGSGTGLTGGTFAVTLQTSPIGSASNSVTLASVGQVALALPSPGLTERAAVTALDIYRSATLTGTYNLVATINWSVVSPATAYIDNIASAGAAYSGTGASFMPAPGSEYIHTSYPGPVKLSGLEHDSASIPAFQITTAASFAGQGQLDITSCSFPTITPISSLNGAAGAMRQCMGWNSGAGAFRPFGDTVLGPEAITITDVNSTHSTIASNATANQGWVRFTPNGTIGEQLKINYGVTFAAAPVNIQLFWFIPPGGVFDSGNVYPTPIVGLQSGSTDYTSGFSLYFQTAPTGTHSDYWIAWRLSF